MAKDLAMLQIVTPRLLLQPLQMPDFEGWRRSWPVPGICKAFPCFRSSNVRASDGSVGSDRRMPDGWPGTEVGWGIITLQPEHSWTT